MSTAVTAHPGGRYDLDAETFVVAPTLAGGGRKAGGYSYDDIPAVAATLTAQYGKNGGIPAGNDCNPVNLIAGTLNAGTKAAGSATQQDAHAGLLVVHGTQDPSVQRGLAHALGRNNGAENAVLASAMEQTLAVCITGSITHTLKAEGFDASEDGTGRGQPIVADVSPTLRAGNQRNNSNPATEADMLVGSSGVRRLTPRECERLQGFPDDYTLIPWRGRPAEECPDGPRYKAIGNSKAVPVVRWIGRRLLRQLGAA